MHCVLMVPAAFPRKAKLNSRRVAASGTEPKQTVADGIWSNINPKATTLNSKQNKAPLKAGLFLYFGNLNFSVALAMALLLAVLALGFVL